MSSIELFNILSKQWANVNDIKKIASCGRDNASRIRNTIINENELKGKRLPVSKEKLVPMADVIKFLNIDIEYISFMAQKEKILL